MDVDELRRLPPFAGLTDVGLQRLAVRAAELRAAGGQVLALEGDPGAGMFVLCDGNVEVELRMGKLELGPGDFFGELALLATDRRTATVTARTDMQLVVMHRQAFLQVEQSLPTVASQLREAVAARMPPAAS